MHKIIKEINAPTINTQDVNSILIDLIFLEIFI